MRLGKGCSVHSGAVLGADGLALPNEQGHFESIAQLGRLRIGDNVSIGAGTMIDRGAIDDTIVGDGVKIDNLVQIGHNCKIGDHSNLRHRGPRWKHRNWAFLAGWCTSVEQNPVKICDQVVISARTTVTHSIDKPEYIPAR